MDNNSTKTTETRSNLEDKLSPESHKVWDLQRKKDILDINSNGKISSDIQKTLQFTMKDGEIMATNYVDSITNKRRMLMKVNNEIFYSDFTNIKEL
jgi:hypothetical protein